MLSLRKVQFVLIVTILTEEVAKEVWQQASTASGLLADGLLRSLRLELRGRRGRSRCRGARIDQESALDAAHVVGQQGIATHFGQQLLAVDAQRLALRLHERKPTKEKGTALAFFKAIIAMVFELFIHLFFCWNLFLWDFLPFF